MPIIIDPIPQAECRAPYYYSERAGGCIRYRPRPQRRENIAWIQACLNTLGFNAGVEDGIAGRRTLAAWDEFRIANGLPGSSAPYSDPQTLAALYEQCRPGNKTPPQGVVTPPDNQAPPPDDPQPVPPANASDSGLKYRQAMCATGPLYRLLKKSLGDDVQIEKCGRSCIPVPDGMSEQEAIKQRNNGVNWCTDCVSFGDDGIVCPLPRTPPQQ